jgi:hypothetical protein
MQKSKERIISFFDVVLTAHTYGQKLDLPPFPLVNFIRQIDAWYQADTCPQLGRHSAETVYLADMSISANRKRVDLLINRSDRDASDTVYSNPKIKRRRKLSKNDGEGHDFSAHMIISLVPKGNTYQAALEVSPGLASGKVAWFLNYLIRHCINETKDDYKMPHPDNSTNSAGVQRLVVAYHKVELRGHPSDELLNSINSGVLDSIELIDKRKRNLNWDSNGNTKEIQRSVILRPGPKASARNFNRIKEAASLSFQKNYSEARVKFKAPNGISTTVTLETQHMQLANDTIYVKKEKISGFSSLIDSSSQSLNPEIVDKMAKLI